MNCVRCKSRPGEHAIRWYVGRHLETKETGWFNHGTSAGPVFTSRYAVLERNKSYFCARCAWFYLVARFLSSSGLTLLTAMTLWYILTFEMRARWLTFLFLCLGFWAAQVMSAWSYSSLAGKNVRAVSFFALIVCNIFSFYELMAIIFGKGLLFERAAATVLIPFLTVAHIDFLVASLRSRESLLGDYATWLNRKNIESLGKEGRAWNLNQYLALRPG